MRCLGCLLSLAPRLVLAQEVEFLVPLASQGHPGWDTPHQRAVFGFPGESRSKAVVRFRETGEVAQEAEALQA